MKPLLAILALFFLAGCPSISKTYVEADRATYEAIAPELREYVKNDDKLADAQKQLRYDALESWAYRLNAAEKASD